MDMTMTAIRKLPPTEINTETRAGIAAVVFGCILDNWLENKTPIPDGIKHIAAINNAPSL